MTRYEKFSSADLIQACASSKDERAWTEFIRRFQLVIAAAAMRTARQWRESAHVPPDDLIQETYLKLCENDNHLLRTFRPQREESIYGFLKVVAANVVHDHFKSLTAEKRGANRTEAITEPLQLTQTTSRPDGFQVVSHRLQLEQIDKILTQLTIGKDRERNRAIFWLRHQQDLLRVRSHPSHRSV